MYRVLEGGIKLPKASRWGVSLLAPRVASQRLKGECVEYGIKHRDRTESLLTVGVVQLIAWNRHDVTTDVRGINHLWNDLLEVSRSNQPHVHRELVVEDVQCVVNAFTPV